jgi:Zn-dependent M28 family amino/carboxypeptidase
MRLTVARATVALPVLATVLPLAFAGAAAAAPPTLSPAEKVAAAKIHAPEIAADVRFLSDDLLEGRAPGSRGERLASRYIAAQMEAAGLEPAGDQKSFFQKVPLVGITPALPKTVAFRGLAGKTVSLTTPSDLVIMSGTQSDGARLPEAEVIFVGYGIVAPEFQWDDYKDVDVRGKVVLIMNNDPQGDPALFAGKTRLWYGRWDYKYLQAARKGAAGAIIIHTTPSAGYPWQVVESSNTAERFELPAGDEPRLTAKMWATEAASRSLAALGGKDLDALRAAAEGKQSRPVPLGVSVALAFTNKVRKLEGENVVGRLPGADAKLKEEAVVFTAHHDHLGIRERKPGGPEDTIYNGALDNASGVALMLSMARAAAQSPRPRRSLLFLAVTAEEQGLLGSEWYCRKPTVPPGRIAANINMDSINIRGRTADFSFIGHGKSSLDQVVEAVAASQGRKVHGDPFPEKGIFYRSDQFNFARVGVPAIYGRGGPTYVGRPAQWGREQAELYEKQRYHQPSDEFDPATWDLAGAIQDGQLLLVTGLRVANDRKLPSWKPGDEFEAARKRALEAAP